MIKTIEIVAKNLIKVDIPNNRIEALDEALEELGVMGLDEFEQVTGVAINSEDILDGEIEIEVF
jgi:hypothetical protein